MKKILIMVAMLAMSTGAYAAAGGGKVNNPWQPVDPEQDVCSAFLPAGIDTDDCTELNSATSGKTYLCSVMDDYVVYCPTAVEEATAEANEDDEQGSSRTDVGNEDRDGDRKGR